MMGAVQIFGLPEQPLENIRLHNFRVVTKGGGTREDAARMPKELGRGYPDPGGKPALPAYGVFARHVKGLELSDMAFSFGTNEFRPAAQFMNIDGLELDHFKAQTADGVKPAEFAGDVRGLVIRNSPEIERTR
jgi:hypothetical protein